MSKIGDAGTVVGTTYEVYDTNARVESAHLRAAAFQASHFEQFDNALASIEEAERAKAITPAEAAALRRQITRTLQGNIAALQRTAVIDVALESTVGVEKVLAGGLPAPLQYLVPEHEYQQRGQLPDDPETRPSGRSGKIKFTDP